MAIYRQVHVSFWQDGFVLDLTPEEKYFYIYLMTNSKTSQCGVYELPYGVIEIDTGYNRETVEKLLKRFEGYGKIKYCAETKEILIVNWMKFNFINSATVKSCMLSEFNKIKSIELKNRFCEITKKLGLYEIFSKLHTIDDNTYGMHRVSIDQGQEKEEEIEKEIKEEVEVEVVEEVVEKDKPSKQNIQQDNAIAFYEHNISKGVTTAHILSQLQQAINEFGEELLMLAMQKTVENATDPTWKYTKAILNSWKGKGITTLKQAIDEQKTHNLNHADMNKNRNTPNHRHSKNKFMNFKQTPYDWEEIERMEMERTLKKIEMMT